MEMTYFQNPPNVQLLNDWFVKCGFSITKYPWTHGRTAAYVVAVPILAVVVACGLLPSAWSARRLTSRRPAATGACVTSGYDLRASKDRCPECGTTIPQGEGEPA